MKNHWMVVPGVRKETDKKTSDLQARQVVARETSTTLDVMLERRITDYWNIEGS